jgi:hypothetical protein
MSERAGWVRASASSQRNSSLAIQAASSWPVGSWAAMLSPVRANARSDSRSRAQQPPPVRPRRVLGGAPPAEVLAGNPLADPGHRLIGQPDQVEVVHHDLRVGQRALHGGPSTPPTGASPPTN